MKTVIFLFGLVLVVTIIIPTNGGPIAEATAEATPEATAEATPEATAETTPDVTAEATLEATAEATPDVTAEASFKTKIIVIRISLLPNLLHSNKSI
ncbi:hypothetical protein ALC57_10567 [Trachymyrmex cornetzi]|uniref:Zonadhesin n=1 Tax=Trachymyrmex cornetzi TaxID=471704 RepID=A0A151J3Y4_9HYME|nr:hypothetical protein ALC57_10567 [Trachymyrmex cornetzi]